MQFQFYLETKWLYSRHLYPYLDDVKQTGRQWLINIAQIPPKTTPDFIHRGLLKKRHRRPQHVIEHVVVQCAAGASDARRENRRTTKRQQNKGQKQAKIDIKVCSGCSEMQWKQRWLSVCFTWRWRHIVVCWLSRPITSRLRDWPMVEPPITKNVTSLK